MFHKIETLRTEVDKLYKDNDSIPKELLAAHNQLIKDNEYKAREKLIITAGDETIELERLKDVLKKQSLWETIMKTPFIFDREPVVLPIITEPLTTDKLERYITQWRAIANSMPDIEEKMLINDELDYLEQHQSTIDSSLAGRLDNFKKRMDMNLFLFQKLDSFLENKKTEEESRKMIDKWENIAKSPNIDESQKQVIQGNIEILKNADLDFRKKAMSLFDTPTMAEIEFDSQFSLTPKEKLLINTIKIKIQKLQSEVDKQGENAPTYKNHKIKALQAAIVYIKNGDSETLVKALATNKDYDEGLFSSLTETKRLIGRACVSKGTTLDKLIPKPKKAPSSAAASENIELSSQSTTYKKH